MKVPIFSNFFVTKKVMKKQTGSAWNFFQPPIQVCRGAYILYFKINTLIFCCPHSFEENLNPQIRINKMVSEHTVDYHHSLSELVSRIYSLLFVWTLKGFISTEYFFNFFLKPVYPTMVVERFQICVYKITGKYICKSKNWIRSFLLMPPSETLLQVLIMISHAEGNYSLSTFSPAEGGFCSWKYDQS